jgi:hypothetical protein
VFRRTQDPDWREATFGYGAVTRSGRPSQAVRLIPSFITHYIGPTTPACKHAGLGSFLFARRYLGNRNFFLFLWLLRCFSSPRLPISRYVFTTDQPPSQMAGFPHSEIFGSKLTCSSPKHIGVCPVLHRLLVPRHPPCALLHLT